MSKYLSRVENISCIYRQGIRFQVTSRLWPVEVPKRLPPAVELAHTAVPKIRFLSMGLNVFNNLPGKQHDVTRTRGIVSESLQLS